MKEINIHSCRGIDSSETYLEYGGYGDRSWRILKDCKKQHASVFCWSDLLQTLKKKKIIVPSSVPVRLFQQCVLRLFGFIPSCFTPSSDDDQDSWSKGKEELNTPPPFAFLQFFDSFTPCHRGQVMLLPYGAGRITPASCGGFPCAREPLEAVRLRFLNSLSLIMQELGQEKLPFSINMASTLQKKKSSTLLL